jgi:hypothetical protein
MIWWLGTSVSEEPAAFCRVEDVLRMEEDNMYYRKVSVGTGLLVEQCQCVVLTGDRQ